MINTAIYDMDGLLLDTEPLWSESMKKIVALHGIPITEKHFKETTGLRIYEVTEHWSINYPWMGKSSLEVANEILTDIIELAQLKGTVLKGVITSLQIFKDNGFKIGLASSSPKHMIETLIDHFKPKIVI